MSYLYRNGGADAVITQGEAERIAYEVDVSAWGDGQPLNPVATVWHGDDDVTNAVTTGAAVADGAVITTPQLHSLAIGEVYDMHLVFTDAGSGNTFAAIVRVRGVR